MYACASDTQSSVICFNVTLFSGTTSSRIWHAFIVSRYTPRPAYLVVPHTHPHMQPHMLSTVVYHVDVCGMIGSGRLFEWRVRGLPDARDYQHPHPGTAATSENNTSHSCTHLLTRYLFCRAFRSSKSTQSPSTCPQTGSPLDLRGNIV